MIEYHKDLSRGGGTVRTVACPFCGAAIGGRTGSDLPHHLRSDCDKKP